MAVEAGAVGPDAVARLSAAYGTPTEAALAAHRRGVPVVGITSCTVPRELIEAAGAFPLVLRRHGAPTPHADSIMERGVFSPRVKGICEGLLAGEWPFLATVIVPRTSEPEYKLFLYLRELARERWSPTLPPVLLFDLLQTPSAEARAYVAGRLGQLRADLAQLVGKSVDDFAIAQAVADTNRAADAVQALTALRAAPTRLTGCEAVVLVGASQFMTARAFAADAEGALATLSSREALAGLHVAIAGAPLDGPRLHEVIERCGAIVTWEEDLAGVMQPRDRIPTGGDPLDALASHYHSRVPSARSFPPTSGDRAFGDMLGRGVRGVVFHLPPDDSTAGWDYPRRRAALDALGISHVILRADGLDLCGDDERRLCHFVDHLRGEH